MQRDGCIPAILFKEYAMDKNNIQTFAFWLVCVEIGWGLGSFRPEVYI